MEYEQALNYGYTKLYENKTHIYLSNFNSPNNAQSGICGYVMAFSKTDFKMISALYVNKDIIKALINLIK